MKTIDNELYVVGIGASAGGLTAINDFFDHISPYIPVAFVIIVHLLRDHRSVMDQILATHTKLPIIRVTNDIQMEPGKIYLLIENQTLSLKGNMLHTRERDKEIVNKSVDIFFESLAGIFKEKTIGIILSGGGRDGLKGALAIKKNGGLIMVQKPETAQTPSMPLNIVNGDHPSEINSPKNLAYALNKQFFL